jgi:DNA invertase Pin-like site-specific DNA recombinase
MNVAAYRPWVPSEGKIRAEHQDRMAMIYIRQSSRQQLVEHQESTRLQYRLVERAQALGWSPARICVIDEDLGRTAAVADSRPGFQKLVTEVMMGRVGIVVGIEMSRLARTGRDWEQLLELCCLSGCLLADPEAVYDPSYFNDRMLLGLKGTVSQAELYLIKQRMASGRLAKAERGDLESHLPIGYVRRPDGEVVLDPDEQARHVVRLVFDAFDRFGTLAAVLRYLADHDIQLPVRAHERAEKGELRWHRPTRATLQNMLHNPIYAGFYAYGRRRVDPRRKIPGRPATGLVVQDRDAWLVVIPDRMPAYITVERYEANIARLAANRNVAESPGAAREGAGLLAGLLRCGRCGGHRMSVQYHQTSGGAATHSYLCAYDKVVFGAAHTCQHIAGPALDRYLAGQVLAALAPAALQVSMTAAAHAEAERADLDKLWRQRVERAQFAADRARRQFQLAEPENRLVVRQLEKDWEATLAEVARLEGDHRRFTDARPVVLTTAERAAIRALAGDLPAVWDAPSTTAGDRKDILRLLIEEITVAVVEDSEQVEVTITWAGGHQTRGTAVRPVARMDQLSYYRILVDRVAELAGQGLTARQIAEHVNAAGLRPPKRTDAFGPEPIRALMARHDIRPTTTSRRTPPTLHATDQWTISALAAELHMPAATVYNWIIRGWLTADKQPSGHWAITADTAELTRLRERRARPHGYYQQRRFTDQADQLLNNGGQQ